MNIEDLDEKSKFVFIASMRIAIEFYKQNLSKDKYVLWCSEVWHACELYGWQNVMEMVERIMKEDLLKFKAQCLKNQ